MQQLKQNLRIGDWFLDKPLGSGGQGTVWKVRYDKDKAKHSPPAALKICDDAGLKARARFSKEITLLKEQNDPGIVRVRDVGDFESCPYYVMELASASLDRVVNADTAGTRLVRESGTLLLMFLRQACRALANLHGRGILHRDIKPGNVLLMLEPPEPMRAMLSDLGVAVAEADQGQITAPHEVVGTQAYRAPESLRDKHTPASDVYSFGKMIEFVFTRVHPPGMGPGQCLRSPIFSEELWSHIDDVLRKACAFDPNHRYQNAQELFDALPEGMVVRLMSGKAPQTRADTTLADAEVTTLVQVIADCPTDSDWTGVYSLQRDSALSRYDFAVALRRLGELGFVENREDGDNNGNTFISCRATDLGFRWAHSHSSEVDAVRRRSSRPDSSQVAGEGDIPF